MLVRLIATGLKIRLIRQCGRQISGLLYQTDKRYDYLSQIRYQKEQILCGNYLGLDVDQSWTGQQYCYNYNDDVKVMGVKEIEQEQKRIKVDKMINLVHNLCHIEYNAFKAYYDTLVRFIGELGTVHQGQFAKDLIEIVEQELQHHQALAQLLDRDGVQYGALGCHKGLLHYTQISTDDLLERLALISIFSEGKALDASPKHIRKVTQDQQLLRVIDEIIEQEVEHVSKGIKWFQIVCQERGIEHRKHYLDILGKHSLKVSMPINWEMRHKAGFDEEWLQMIVDQ